MSDVLHYLFLGFSTALTQQNLFFCFVGVSIGTLVGVLPGLGPLAAMSLLLPATYHIPPMGGIIMLSGIFYGTQYGGSITSILVNIPGEAASVVTCIDGYQMALKGRAGAALGMSAFGSFIGGTLSIVGLMLVAPPLARLALAIGPPEFFSLLLLGVLLMTYLGSGSTVKLLMMAVLGLFLGTIGADMMTGVDRFVYGSLTLIDGLGIAPVAMGLFGVSEVLINIPEIHVKKDLVKTKIKNLLPNAHEWRLSAKPIARGTILGFLTGVLPGASIIASFSSYAVEKKLSKHPEEFGKGAIEGVAGPETANNAATGGAFIPLMTLGVPSTGVMAILLGAFLIHGLQPGPLLMKNNPLFFWGIVASMYIGNVMLLVLNIPLIGIWVQLLRIPYSLLLPIILMLSVLGCYSVSSNIYEVVIMGALGILGYLLRKFGFSCGPLVFGLILSPMIEIAFRQSLAMSQGSLLIFVQRPISLGFIIIFLFIILSPILKLSRWKDKLKGLENP